MIVVVAWQRLWRQWWWAEGDRSCNGHICGSGGGIAVTQVETVTEIVVAVVVAEMTGRAMEMVSWWWQKA